MVSRLPLTLAAFLVPGLLAAAPARADGPVLTLDFRKAPERVGWSVVGDDDGRLAHDRQAGVSAIVDSTLPSQRLLAPLGRTLTGADPFVLEVELTVQAIDGSPDDFMQLSLGLVSSGTTGLNRTGTVAPPPIFFVDDADAHDAVELAYFPNRTSFGGPFLQPAVFGGEVGSLFTNFAANFGSSSDLGDNTGEQLRELPVVRRLRFVLVHDACAQLLVTRLFDAGSGAELLTGLEPVDVSFVNATATFEVDSFALSLYQDLADADPSTRSLFADLDLHAVRLHLPGPPTARLRPTAVNPGARGSAQLRVDGSTAAWLGDAPVARLTDAAGDVHEVALAATGSGTLHGRVPRALAADPALSVELAGCALPLVGPARVVGK